MSDNLSGQQGSSKIVSDGSQTAIPGQVVLPGMAAAVGYDSATLEPWKERFCRAYVEEADSIGYKAYLIVKPKVVKRTAEVESSKLLSLPEIQARIAEIQKELQRRWFVEVDDIREFHGKVMKIDRRRFYDEHGHRIPVHQLPDDLAAIVDIDATYSKDAGIVLLPVVASKVKSAEAMARIMGLDKSTVALTGKDGGPVEHRHQLTDEMLEAIALGKAAV